MADNQKDIVRELEKRILWFREETEELDPEEIDELCALIEKLAPDEEPHLTKEEAYENIMRRVDAGEVEIEEDETEPAGNGRKGKGRVGARKRAMRAAVIAALVFGIFFSLDRVTYARENKSLFTMILEKVGVLEIEKEEGTEGTLIDGGMITKEFVGSWGELGPDLKEKIMVPKYIPEGYSLYGIKSWESDNRKIVQANYYDKKNGHILFEITIWSDSEDHYKETVVEEDENKLIIDYSSKNTMYYQYEDEYICLVFDEDVFYRISGNITLEEMIKIREGVGVSGDAR